MESHLGSRTCISFPAGLSRQTTFYQLERNFIARPRRTKFGYNWTSWEYQLLIFSPWTSNTCMPPRTISPKVNQKWRLGLVRPSRSFHLPSVISYNVINFRWNVATSDKFLEKYPEQSCFTPPLPSPSSSNEPLPLPSLSPPSPLLLRFTRTLRVRA